MIRLKKQSILKTHSLTAFYFCAWLLQSSALQDITTTPALTAVSAVPPAHTKESLDRTTALPAPETQPLTLMVPLVSCNAKVCQFRSTQCIWLEQEKTLNKPSCVSLIRSTLWRRAGRFHRLHRVSQLPGKLPSQRRVHLDHKPTAQT